MKYEKNESWSNLAYAIAGIASFLLYGNVTFSLVLSTMGVGSFIYHRWKDLQRWPIVSFDWFAMALTQFYIMAELATLTPYEGTIHTVLAFALPVYGFFIIREDSNIVYHTVVIALAGLLVSYLAQGWLITAVILVIFGVATFVRSLDGGHDQSVLKDSSGHTAWHFLTAFGFFLLIHLKDMIG